MSIYICEKCGAIENTALGGYWLNCLNNEPKMCSECNYGKWHGEFEKQYWTDYTPDELIRMEERNDGSMLNATSFLKSKGWGSRK